MSNPNNTGRNIRLLVLFGVLALMLAALWYDRGVARPGVDAAYDAIAKLNDKINTSAGNKWMTNQDVQNELKRKPSRIRTEGPYEIEVYSWMAGLPFRTHDYYAVYSKNGNERVFKTHYKNQLPLKELLATREAPAPGRGEIPEPPPEAAAAGPQDQTPSGAKDKAGEPKGKKERRKGKKGAKTPPSDEVKAGVAEKSEGKEPAKAPDAAATPEAAKTPDTSASEPPKTEKADSAPPKAAPGPAAPKDEKDVKPTPPAEKKDQT